MGVPKVYQPGKPEEMHVGDDATVKAMKSKASGKAKANYTYPPLGVGQDNGQAGKMKVRALTPGTTPSGS